MQDEFLLVGLGNPGSRYADTRHNVGFMVIDRFAKSIGAPPYKEKFSGQFSRARHAGSNVNLLKPTTFMNLSGQSVVSAANFYRIPPENLIIIHDELDLPLGTIRLKEGGGTGGHKGLASVQEQLGKSNFIRIRLGIGRPESDEEDLTRERSSNISNYVLDNFTKQEEGVLVKILSRSDEAVECVMRRGITAAMNEFNKRGGETDGS